MTVAAVAIDLTIIVNGAAVASLLNITRTLASNGILIAAIQSIAELSQSTQVSVSTSEISFFVTTVTNLLSGNFINKITAKGM